MTTAVAVLALAGCGGGSDQSADEPSGTFKVDVVGTSFPERQHLAETQRFTIDVRNAGTEAIPNVSVTLDGFSATASQAGLADANRPVWIIDDGPRGGTTAYVNTWALGRLAPGETKRFAWLVTAVFGGEHRLGWRVGAGLTGKGQAVTQDDRSPEGAVLAHIDSKPAQATVDPATGAVHRTY